MAQITINIPDAILPRVLNAFARKYKYSPVLDDGTPNPETKQQHARRRVIEYIKSVVRESEVSRAQTDAADTASASVDTDIVLS